MTYDNIETALEAILFAAGEPVALGRLADALELQPSEAEMGLKLLADRLRFERRGMRVVEMDGLFQMVSSPEYAEVIRRVLEERKPAPLSKAALEVLSIIAYHQPVTRAEIERIRGVDSSHTVQLLCDKELIEEAGRLEVLGRPMRFRTTPVFLRSFGLRDLADLPELDELEGQLTLRTLPQTQEAAPDTEPEAAEVPV